MLPDMVNVFGIIKFKLGGRTCNKSIQYNYTFLTYYLPVLCIRQWVKI